MPDNKIDIGRTALIVAKDFYPDLNIDRCSAKIDDIVREFNKLFPELARLNNKGMQDPDFRIRGMNNYFFLHKGIRYDLIDFELNNPQNVFLSGILDTGKGACVTMPVLYLAITQRLDWPIYGVKTPEHLFLRYDDGKYRSNIEVTGGGGWSPDEDYIKQLQITEEEVKNGVYLKIMSHKQTLGTIIGNRADLYLRRGEYKKAARDYRLCIRADPTNVESINNLSRIYRNHLDKYQEGKKLHQKLIELGFNFDRIGVEADPGYAEHVLAKIKAQGLVSLYGDKLKYLEEAIEVRKKRKADILCKREEEALAYEQELLNLLPEHMRGAGLRESQLPGEHHSDRQIKRLEELDNLEKELTKYSKKPGQKPEPLK